MAVTFVGMPLTSPDTCLVGAGNGRSKGSWSWVRFNASAILRSLYCLLVTNKIKKTFRKNIKYMYSVVITHRRRLRIEWGALVDRQKEEAVNP
jgi:hypothetical protein